MKTINNLLLSLASITALCAILLSCSKDSDENPKEDLFVDANCPNGYELDGDGATTSIVVNSNTEWTSTVSMTDSENKWFSPEFTLGKGNRTIPIVIKKNNGSSIREARIIFYCDKSTKNPKELRFTQKTLPPFFEVSTSIISFKAFGNAGHEVKVESNLPWTVSVSAKWLTINKTSGNGMGSFTVTASDNEDNIDRSATITIETTDGNYSKTINVTQPYYKKLFEEPYTSWGASRSMVKSYMTGQGYALIGESTTSKDNYYLAYKGKYSEKSSTYIFDASQKYIQVCISFNTSVGYSYIEDYLTAKMNCHYAGESNGNSFYYTNDKKTGIIMKYNGNFILVYFKPYSDVIKTY